MSVEIFSALWLWLLYFMVLVSGVVSVSYVLVWVFMELSLLVSILYFFKKEVRSGSNFYYYVIQVVGSLFMIIGAITGKVFVLLGGFVVKLALFPAIAWIVSVIWGMGLMAEVFMLLFLQKIVPMVLVFRWGWLLEFGVVSVVVVAVMGVVVGSFLMVYGESLKWVLAMSSVTHTSWLFYLLVFYPASLIFYFCVYGVILLLILIFWRLGFKFVSFMVVLGLGSVPPLVGFFIKFYNLGLVSSLMIMPVIVGLLVVIVTVLGYFVNMMKTGMVFKVVGIM